MSAPLFTIFAVKNMPVELRDKIRKHAREVRRLTASTWILEAIREKLEREEAEYGA